MQVSGKNAKGSMTRGEPIQYSPVNITFNAIPVWGVCHKKVDENVLLMDRWVEIDEIKSQVKLINSYFTFCSAINSH